MGWNLKDIFVSDAEFEECVQELAEKIERLGATLSQIEDGKTMGSCLDELERLSIAHEKASVYVNCILLLDGTDKKAISDSQKMAMLSSKLVTVKNTVMYEFAEKYKNDPQCDKYSVFLYKLADKVRHSGSRDAENLFAEMSAISKNWAVLHKANLAQTKTLGSNPISLASATANQLKDDPAIRREGYLGEQSICERASSVARFALCSIKSENILEARMRGFSSVLEMCLHQDGIDNVFFEQILDTAKIAAEMATGCLAVKQRLSGNNGLKWYNLLYVASGKGEALSWETALDSIRSIGQKTGVLVDGILQRAVTENWIDYEQRPSKRSGACCNSLHAKKATYMMLTFSGSVKNYVSLSHELGHAVHHAILQENNFFDSFAPMPINEAVAIFFDLIAGDELASRYPQYANAVLEGRINNIITTFLEVQSRFLFEKDLFSQCGSRFPDMEELCEMALSTQKSVFGDTGDKESYHPYVWVSKPHFYYQGIPFYNYPYMIARLAAYSLYGRWLEEGALFFEHLLGVLSQSGKANVQETLALLGVGENNCWRFSLDRIREVIEQWNGQD